MTPTKGYAVHNATDTLGPFDFERREVGPHDVQFEILFCGVCHSDIHQVRNEWGNSVYPMVPGHEIVGRVTAVGEHVQKFKTGDLAGVGCLVDSCRECDNCQKGLEQFCRQGATGTYNSEDKKHGGLTYGGYSNQIVVDENYVVKVSEKLDLAAVAPLLCAGITTYSPLKHWKVGPGHKVAVVGLGGLGHMAVKFAAAFGADVTVLSTSPSKEADATALGAHHFALTKDPEQLPGLQSKFDFIVDTVSAPHDYNMYLSMLNTDGVMICVGVPPTPMEVLGFNLLGGRRSIAGSAIGGLPETQEMLDYCAEHGIVSDIEMIDMSYIEQAYERMLKGDVKYRFVVDMATL
ncbi:MAG: NAD(P)-dependent alcohol dehydrogenase [Janthinobacterium lividum]